MVIDKSVLDRVKFTCQSSGPLISRIQIDSSIAMYASDRYNYTFGLDSLSQIHLCPGSYNLLYSGIKEVGDSDDYEAIIKV
jgi:hypothetical protein